MAVNSLLFRPGMQFLCKTRRRDHVELVRMIVEVDPVLTGFPCQAERDSVLYQAFPVPKIRRKQRHPLLFERVCTRDSFKQAVVGVYGFEWLRYDDVLKAAAASALSETKFRRRAVFEKFRYQLGVHEALAQDLEAGRIASMFFQEEWKKAGARFIAGVLQL